MYDNKDKLNLELNKMITYREKAYRRYELAMEAKKVGNTNLVIEMLIPSVVPPSIYKGHYKELFVAYRKKNKNSIKEGKVMEAIDKLKEMIKLDSEMIDLMYNNWSKSFFLPKRREYFLAQSNIKITDIKLLLQLSIQENDNEGISLAEDKIKKYQK